MQGASSPASEAARMSDVEGANRAPENPSPL